MKWREFQSLSHRVRVTSRHVVRNTTGKSVNTKIIGGHFNPLRSDSGNFLESQDFLNCFRDVFSGPKITRIRPVLYIFLCYISFIVSAQRSILYFVQANGRFDPCFARNQNRHLSPASPQISHPGGRALRNSRIGLSPSFILVHT